MTTTLLPVIGVIIGRYELILIVASLVCLAFWIWMIADCALCESATGTKVGWLLAIFLVGPIAAPLYYLVRKLPRYWIARKPENAGGGEKPGLRTEARPMK